jgi:hypothetical protein
MANGIWTRCMCPDSAFGDAGAPSAVEVEQQIAVGADESRGMEGTTQTAVSVRLRVKRVSDWVAILPRAL